MLRTLDVSQEDNGVADNEGVEEEDLAMSAN